MTYTKMAVLQEFNFQVSQGHGDKNTATHTPMEEEETATKLRPLAINIKKAVASLREPDEFLLFMAYHPVENLASVHFKFRRYEVKTKQR